MTLISRFRIIALLEGISFLLLLGIAMPLKYIWDMPLAVKYVGWAHGLLFILYFLILIPLAIQQEWKFKKLFFAGLASILPFGTFWFERKMLREGNE